jgi:glycerol-1-phosphate dehydrogenase [NAD(P)+]
MASQLVEDLLKHGARNPLTGQMVRFPIRQILMERALLKQTPELTLSLFPGVGSLAIISDGNTHKIAAEALEHALHKRMEIISIILPSSVKPTMEEVRHIKSMTREAGAFLAVGSGTVNDLVKYTSYSLDKPYAVFATAPSMNGYASANASIEEHGYRHSFPAHMPQAILMDLDILASAPRQLILSGLGDSICRSTAQADWLLSYLLLGTDYVSTPFDWLIANEKRLFPSVDRLVQQSREAIELLCENLILSGLGMAFCGGSYPASQGEHMIAHTMGMLHGKKLPSTFHGQEIGVTTLTMARLQELMLESMPVMHHISRPDAWFADTFTGDLSADFRRAYRKKELSPQKTEALNQRIARYWPEIVAQLKKSMLPASEIEGILTLAGAYTQPQEIGWPPDLYQKVVRQAPFTRDRFTFLDLATLGRVSIF